MKSPDHTYNLDAEIAKYGGHVFLRTSPLGAADTVAPTVAPVPFDLDAEIAKYGGHVSPRSTTPSVADKD
jgi:hypothetical protein